MSEDSIYINCTNRSQQGLLTCGYWAVFNAVMTVLTGTSKFYKTISVEPNLREEKINNLIHADLRLKVALESLVENPPRKKCFVETAEILDLTKSQQTPQADTKSPYSEHKQDLPTTTPDIKNEQDNNETRDDDPVLLRKVGKKKRGRPKTIEPKAKTSARERSKATSKPPEEMNTTKKTEIIASKDKINEETKMSAKERCRARNRPLEEIDTTKKTKTMPSKEGINEEIPIFSLKPHSRKDKLIIQEKTKETPDIMQIKQNLPINQNENDTINNTSPPHLNEYLGEIEKRLKTIEMNPNYTCKMCEQLSNKIIELSEKIVKMEEQLTDNSSKYKKIELCYGHIDKKLETMKKEEEKRKIALEKTIEGVSNNMIQFKELQKGYSTKLENTINTIEESHKHLQSNFEIFRENSSMEIEELRKGDQSQSFLEITSKEGFNELEEKFRALSLQVQEDFKFNSKIINKNTQKIDELIRNNGNTIKIQTTKKDDNILANLQNQLDKKMTELEIFVKTKVDQIQREINNVQSTKLPLIEWNKIMEELKKVEHNCNDKSLYFSDTVDTKIIPCIQKIDKKIEGVTNRLDTLYKFRNQNRYLKDKEQRGICINTEPLDEIIKAKRESKGIYNEQNFIPIPVNEESKTLTEDFQEGKKYKIHLEFTPKEDPSKFFREVYVEYGRCRRKAKLYFSKIREDSTNDEYKNEKLPTEHEQRRGEELSSPTQSDC